MPIYDYECHYCHNYESDVLVSSNPEDQVCFCEVCGHEMDRQTPTPALVRGPTPRYHATPSPAKALVKREDS